MAAAPSIPPVSPAELASGLAVARAHRVAVFVVAYNAEEHIQATLRRIPLELRDSLAAIYVIDDRSRDRTQEQARAVAAEIPGLRVFRTPVNQGYGGNQKLGYRYAIRERFDVVVLLHGDGQYAPEVLPRLLAPFADADVAAVFGSRMLEPGAARRGGMPLYKFVGNRILSWLENRLLGTRLSEFHSGYRAYRVAALQRIPFAKNTSDFHFDTEIIVQLLQRNLRIVEVPIPTYYGDEICHVNGVGYAFQCVRTVLTALANRVHLVYHPKYDVAADGEYQFKQAPNSLHQHVVHAPLAAGATVVDLGAGHGGVAGALAARGLRALAVDHRRPPAVPPGVEYLEADLDAGFAAPVLARTQQPVDAVTALDVLEHLAQPERAMAELRQLLRPGGQLLASTGNVAYLVVRLCLLLGMFNYGKKGILDLTHKRLFTVRSFCRLLETNGFRVESVRGFGPPIRDMVGQSLWWRAVDRVAGWLARVWPRLFAYQMLVVATRLDDIEDILQRTVASAGEARP